MELQIRCLSFHREASKRKGFYLSGLNFRSEANLSRSYQILICGTHVIPQLRQFWADLRTELADENPHKASIGGMRLTFSELQESDLEAQKVRAGGLKDGYEEEVDGELHHQIIRTELIGRE